MTDEIRWWGYIHTSGSLHAKRYFDKRDIEEAKESPFCARVFGPDYDSQEAVLDAMRMDNTFNYVDVVGAGCKGWLNLFFGENVIALVKDVELADRIRKEILKRSKRET